MGERCAALRRGPLGAVVVVVVMAAATACAHASALRLVHTQRLDARLVELTFRTPALSDDTSRGFGVRVVVDGAWGFASSSRLEAAEVDRVVGLAVEIAWKVRGVLSFAPAPLKRSFAFFRSYSFFGRLGLKAQLALGIV